MKDTKYKEKKLYYFIYLFLKLNQAYKGKKMKKKIINKINRKTGWKTKENSKRCLTRKKFLSAFNKFLPSVAQVRKREKHLFSCLCLFLCALLCNILQHLVEQLNRVFQSKEFWNHVILKYSSKENINFENIYFYNLPKKKFLNFFIYLWIKNIIISEKLL